MYNSLVPIVVEKTPMGERSYDIYSRLMKDRIVVLGEQVSDHSANRIIASLLYLDKDKKADISFYINSPGGSVTAGLSIYDTMKALRSDIQTICMGQAASMGAFLLAGGTKGKRMSLPHSRIMIHQVSAGAQGPYEDMKRTFNEVERLNKVLVEIMAENVGQPIDKVKQDIDRDYFMSSSEALDYGIIDNIVSKIPYQDEEGN